MSPDVLLECPRTSFRYVLRVNVTERVWHSPRVRGGEVIDEKYKKHQRHVGRWWRVTQDPGNKGGASGTSPP